MANEKNFENRIKSFLKMNDCWYVKYFANRNTRVGVPDILACVNGFFMGIEVKATTGKASEIQKWNVKKILECGGFGMVLYPKDFDLFIKLVLALKNNEFVNADLLLKKINEQLTEN